jgi:hypothetical protein
MLASDRRVGMDGFGFFGFSQTGNLNGFLFSEHLWAGFSQHELPPIGFSQVSGSGIGDIETQAPPPIGIWAGFRDSEGDLQTVEGSQFGVLGISEGNSGGADSDSIGLAQFLWLKRKR